MLLTITDSVSSFAQFITVLIIFIFVLGVTYFTTRYIAGYQKARIKTGNMELVESLRISNNKYLQIVRAGERYIVMAVCKDTVTLLAELEKDELVFIDQGEAAVPDFKGVLDKARQFCLGNKNQDTDKRK